MNPPRFARALLFATAGAVDAEFLAGDLEEEFRLICECRGRSAGKRWYTRQVILSIAPLTALRVRSGELTAVTLRAAFGVIAPLLLLDRLWSFVYSQIPLKAGVERAPEYLALNVLCLAAGAALSEVRPVVAAAAAGAAVIVSAGATPPAYILAVILMAPASSLIARLWRKSE